ncbi:hypothetical protein SUGI_0313090 [Cryptomeria japonica]|nr:hypothetical protein SUGI_0313090 [Cryptomeria japonica]
MFFKRTRATVAFGLNALNGRKEVLKCVLGGPWVSNNAYDFIQYTVDHGYRINAWELGNELTGSGVGTRISSKQYAADVIKLNGILTKIYEDFQLRPQLDAPDGFLMQIDLRNFFMN